LVCGTLTADIINCGTSNSLAEICSPDFKRRSPIQDHSPILGRNLIRDNNRILGLIKVMVIITNTADRWVDNILVANIPADSIPALILHQQRCIRDGTFSSSAT